MQHFITQLSSTGMIVLLVTSVAIAVLAAALFALDFYENHRRIRDGRRYREAIRARRLKPEPEIRTNDPNWDWRRVERELHP